MGFAAAPRASRNKIRVRRAISAAVTPPCIPRPLFPLPGPLPLPPRPGWQPGGHWR